MRALAVLLALAVLGGPAAWALQPEPDGRVCVENVVECWPDAPLGWLSEMLFGLVTNHTNNAWHPQQDGLFEVTRSVQKAVGGPGMAMMEADSIGLTVGGAQDVGNFRSNIENGYLPQATDITPEGLFSEYYFDTVEEPCDGLFCPSYSKAVTPDPLSNRYEVWLSVGLNSGLQVEDFERPDLDLVVVLDVSGSMSSSLDEYHYDGSGRAEFGSMTKMEAANRAVAGLTDNLGPDDRLGIVLFDDQTHVARPLLPMEGVDRKTLKENIMGIHPAGGTNMEGGMRAGTAQFFGGVPGWGQACGSSGEWCADSLDQIRCHCPEGHGCVAAEGWCLDSPENLTCVCTDPQGCPDAIHWCIRPGPWPADGRADRIIFLTDAMPNIGDTSEYGLLGMVKGNAADDIHTTFVGIGVDFNTELVDAITKVRGANYHSVHSPDEFNQRMVEEFDFMVTPLVYDLELTLESESWKIAGVYGSPDADEATGTLMSVNTLFPSNKTDGETRGGLVLMRLDGSCPGLGAEKQLREVLEVASACEFEDSCVADGMVGGCMEPINLTVSYVTGGESHVGVTSVEIFRDVDEAMSVAMAQFDKHREGGPGDGIYDNDGIRKGVLLSRYAELMQGWIVFQRAQAGGIYLHDPEDRLWPQPEWPQLGHWERASLGLAVSPPYGSMIERFGAHFAAEAAALGDPELEREAAILDGLAALGG